MTVHDTVRIGGVSEACKYCDHEQCRAPGCSCDCHQPAPNPNTPAIVAGPEKACPKCGSRRPFGETYCRVDGERLASLLCGVCGSGMNVEDSFCFNCGGPKGTQGPKVMAKVVTVPEVEVGYEQQVLRGLQEELSNVATGDVRKGDGQTPAVVGQEITEQPMGTQGSFKLVSGPSPNKIRAPGGAPVGTQPVRGGRLPAKLPVKPS